MTNPSPFEKSREAIQSRLCDDPNCPSCNLVRKISGLDFTAAPQPQAKQQTEDEAFAQGLTQKLQDMGFDVQLVYAGEEPQTILESTFTVPGYERLALILEQAYDQAARGKGKERHANDLPFDEQPMQTIAQEHGIGFITGQARKKMEEALGMLQAGNSDAAIKEMLGSIVYMAGAVIHVQDRMD